MSVTPLSPPQSGLPSAPLPQWMVKAVTIAGILASAGTQLAPPHTIVGQVSSWFLTYLLPLFAVASPGWRSGP